MHSSQSIRHVRSLIYKNKTHKKKHKKQLHTTLSYITSFGVLMPFKQVMILSRDACCTQDLKNYQIITFVFLQVDCLFLFPIEMNTIEERYASHPNIINCCVYGLLRLTCSLGLFLFNDLLLPLSYTTIQWVKLDSCEPAKVAMWIQHDGLRSIRAFNGKNTAHKRKADMDYSAGFQIRTHPGHPPFLLSRH